MKKLSLLLVSFLFLFPLISKAALLGYGGHVTFSVPCPCSGGMNVFFDRLYINSPVPISGFIYYPSASLLYSMYLPGIPLTWEVGKFTPGVQACYVPFVDGCILLPSLGTINYLGTSLPLSF